MASPQATSRLELIHARFQQKHLREKEQRLLELYDQRQQRAYHIASKGSAASVNSLNKPKDPAMERQTISRTTTIVRETSSNGKARQMFDDRRQATVKGIDRSHPLEPLDNKPNNRKRITNSNTTPSYVTSNRSSAATRQVVTIKRVVRADHNSNAKGVEQTDSSTKSYSLQYNHTISDLGNGNNACLPINQNGYESEQTDANKTERAEALVKVQLMDHDRNGIRVTNDLESEGLAQDSANLASNKLPITRSAANKSSTAETKLERFRASNVKGDGVTAKTTFTKKQPEVPSVSYRNTNSPSSVQQFARRASADTNKTQGVSTKRAVGQKQSVETKTKEVKSLGRVVPRPNKLLSEKNYKKISEDLLPEDAVQDKIQQDFISSEHKNNGLTKKSTTPTLYSSKDELRSPSSLSTDSNTSRGNYQTSVTKKPGTSSKQKSPDVQSQNLTNIDDDILTKCKICGRNFAQERVARHEQICEKSAQKKRRQFDSVMCRVKGTEMESFVHNKKGTKKEPKMKKTSNSSNWRKKHEDFINAIRSAKQVQAHLAAGGKLSDLPPPPASDNSDYIQCPHCNRKFNVPAAERHIPVCERMKHNKTNNRAPPKPRR